MDATIWVQILGGILGTIVVGAICFWLGGRDKQSITACNAICAARDKQRDLDREKLERAQAELSCRQDDLDDENGRKLDIVFRMLRAAIQFLPISEKEKAEIINERGGK